jgi:hypothetical protein
LFFFPLTFCQAFTPEAETSGPPTTAQCQPREILIHPGAVANHRIMPATISAACVCHVMAPENTSIEGTTVRQRPTPERILKVAFTLSPRKIVSEGASAAQR